MKKGTNEMSNKTLHKSMKPDAALAVLEVMKEANIPVMLWGNPGLGKTQAVKNWASHKGYKVHTLVGSQLDPTDVGGYPIPQPEMRGVKHVSPSWFQQIVSDSKDGQPWIIFLDELTCTPPGVQGSLFKLICDREVNNELLPNCTRIIAAGNDVNLSSSVGLSEPMQTRFAHINWSGYSLSEVLELRSEGWPLPKLPNTIKHTLHGQAAWDAVISQSAKSEPSWNDDLASGGVVAKQGRGYPCLRSWSYLSHALSCLAPPAKINTELLADVAVSLVGRGPGVQFANTVRDFKLPDPETWIANPKLATSLESEDSTFAAAHSVVHAVAANSTQDRWNNAMEVALNLSEKSTLSIAASMVYALVTLTKRKSPDGSTRNLKVPNSIGKDPRWQSLVEILHVANT